MPNSRPVFRPDWASGITAAVTISALLAGCGGGGKGSPLSPTVSDMGRETVQTYGSVTSRMVGTAQTPVTSSGQGVTVTGIAGALVTDMTVTPGVSEQIAWFTYPAAGGQEIACKNADGSGSEMALTVNANPDEEPQWSPNGTKMVWRGMRNGNFEILIKNTDGSGSEINLSNNAAVDESPQWSPNGTKIAWAGVRNGTKIILVKNADGSGSELNVSKTAGDNTIPQWSPDGTKIVWVGDFTGTNKEILVRNSDGSGSLINVSNNAAQDRYPEWSPDGTKIVWAGERGGDSEILVKNAHGTGAETNVSNNTGDDYYPQWSPDGTRIAWNESTGGDIYVRNADGTSSAINISNAPGGDSGPQWSPDSTKIVWMGNRGADTEILVKNANGTGAEINVSNNSYHDLSPQWSPVPLHRQTRLVGADGILGTTAAGFLIGLKGSAFSSVATFDTAPATRANVRVSAQTLPETGGPNVVFIVSAGDTLTSLRYTTGNGSSQGTKTVIGPGAVVNATHALVSIDASTGQVALVVPYNANRSVDTAPESAGDVLTYRGNFPAAFDGSGTNLAPNGATEVQVNARTGQVLSVR